MGPLYRRLFAVTTLAFGAVAVGSWSVHSGNELGLARPVPVRSFSASDRAQVQNDIRRLQYAVFGGDCDTALKLAHQRWVAAIGGSDAMCQEIKGLALGQNPAGQDIVFKEMAFPEEPTLLQSSKHLFVIVPSVCVFTRKDNRIEIPTFDLAVRRLGRSEWRYVGGSELDEKQALALFPDLPTDLRFPPKATKFLDR